MNPLIKEYGLMILIFLIMLVLVPPLLVQYLGAAGVYAGYLATGIVLVIAYWLTKQIQKSKAIAKV